MQSAWTSPPRRPIRWRANLVGPVDEPSGGDTADPWLTAREDHHGNPPVVTSDWLTSHRATRMTIPSTPKRIRRVLSAAIESTRQLRKDDSEVRKPVQPATVQAKSTTAHETSGAETNNPTSVSKMTAGANRESGDNSDGVGQWARTVRPGTEGPEPDPSRNQAANYIQAA